MIVAGVVRVVAAVCATACGIASVLAADVNEQSENTDEAHKASAAALIVLFIFHFLS